MNKARFMEYINRFIEKCVSDDNHVAVQIWAHFTALIDDENSLFGPVKMGIPH